MGSSESKSAVPAEKKPEPAFKKTHISHLVDPRSPSGGIDRTPIQVRLFFILFAYLFAAATANSNNSIHICAS